MTTIAYRDGVMAADSSSTDNCGMVYETDKLIKSDGWLVGLSGITAACEEYRHWFKGLDKSGWPVRCPQSVKVDSDDYPVDGLIVSPKGVVWAVNGMGIPFKVTGKFFASGSGRAYALGAMASGASAADSVKVAKRFDNHTGGKVRVVKL